MPNKFEVWDLRRIVHLKSGWSPKVWVNRNFDIHFILDFKIEFKKHSFLTFCHKIKEKINLKFIS